MHTRLLIALLATCPLSARAQRAVFPADRATMEGNRSGFYLGASQLRYQQLEVQALGLQRTWGGLAFRRDGVAGRDPQAARVRMTVRVGGGLASGFGSDFGRNWVAAPVAVVANQFVSLPALRRTGGAQPFAARIPFSAAVTHSGAYALLWELVISQAPPPRSYSCDMHSATPVLGSPTPTLPGCFLPVANVRFVHVPELLMTAASARLTLSGGPLLSGSPGFGLLGLRRADTPVPGVCGRLGLVPLAFLDLGPSSQFGLQRSYSLAPPSPAWIGLTFLSQLGAVNGSQPVLSSSVETRVRTIPSSPVQSIAWSRFANANQADILELGSGLVVEFR